MLLECCLLSVMRAHLPPGASPSVHGEAAVAAVLVVLQLLLPLLPLPLPVLS